MAQKPARDPPGFLAAFYHEVHSQKPTATPSLVKRPLQLSPRPLGYTEIQVLNKRLQTRLAPLNHLLKADAAHPKFVSELSYSEGVILNRHLLPILGALHPDGGGVADLQSVIAGVDLCFDELARVVSARLPDLHTLLDSLRGTVNAWLHQAMQSAAQLATQLEANAHANLQLSGAQSASPTSTRPSTRAFTPADPGSRWASRHTMHSRATH